jgi:sodium/potassium-transporting ATPase subunit alpha
MLWLVVLISAILDFVQQRKSLNIMAAFKNMVPLKAIAIRDGKQTTIMIDTLVVGDLVLIKSGDKIPADMRIIHCSNLKVFYIAKNFHFSPPSQLAFRWTILL